MTNNSSKTKKTLSMLNIIGLKESIDSLLKKESKYIPVAAVCKAYLKKLNEGAHEETIASDFVNELSKVAVHESSKSTVYALNNKLSTYKRDIDIINQLYEMENTSHRYVVPMIESAIVDYLTNKCAETRQGARKVMSLFEGVSEINSIFEALSFDEYEEKTGHTLVNSLLNEEMLPKEEKTFTKEEVDKMIQEETSKALQESEERKMSQNKSIDSIYTHIDLHSMINNLIKKEGKNEGLRSYCEQYINALNTGKQDEVLYESFVSGLSRWNYLNAVDTEISALKERISKYSQDIDLKKILETMNQTTSYYIVPLIEGLVVDYINNKNTTNKTVLRNRLQAFEYDPFVRDIINIIMKDNSIQSNLYLGESVENCNGYVHTEKIFSPVKYIKENECVFNVKGTYYDRKGNNITKLSANNIQNLDESFKRLCNLINHPAVTIDDLSNTISIFEGKDSAKVSESEISINGEKVTVDELNSLVENACKMNDYKVGFYRAVQMINESFDNIAYIDFVKRVAMNESNGKTVDVFRIKDNLFVATTDTTLGQSTFYRNVNPMQCRSYINEHMELNVAPMFEDILPNQHAILEDIDETKKSYETYIDELDSKREMLLSMKESSDDEEDIDAAIALIDDEKKSVVDAYKKYQEESDEYINGSEDDKDVDSVDDVANIDDPNDDPDTTSTTETPAEMETPIEDDPNVDQDVQDELNTMNAENDMLASATPYDSGLDAIDDKLEVQVLRVSYDENVKSGIKKSQGQVFIVVPSVNANGDVQDEVKTIRFYLDNERKPILNNEYMPLSLYKTVVNAISEDPETATVEIGNAGEFNNTQDNTFGDQTSLSTPSTDELSTPVNVVKRDSDDLTDTLIDPDDTDIQGDNASTNNIDSTQLETEPMDGLEPEDDSDTSIVNDTPEDSSNAMPLDTPEVETPAETSARGDETTYPVELGLSITDIKPIRKDKFEDDLDDLGIEHSEVEGIADAVDIKIKSKSDAYALRDYFKEWKNYSPAEFDNFFPELKACFKNKPKVSVMQIESKNTAKNESVKIFGINPINESRLYSDNSKGRVNIVLPYTADYAKMFGYYTGNGNPSHIQIITENVKETADVYKKLSTYAKTVGENLDEDAKQFLNRYTEDFKNINEELTYTLTVPFNGFLAQKLATKGITFSEVNEGINVTLKKEDFSKAKKIFKGFYGDAAPIAVKDFFHFSEKSLDEGVKITIHDDKSGKTIELDTDDMDNKEPDDNFSSSFKNTTFDITDSALYQADDDSSDEGSDKDKEDSDDKEKDKPIASTTDDSDDSDKEENKQSDSEEKSDADENETDEESDKEKSEQKKKRFTFRKKVHESIDINSKMTNINESAVNIYDYVKVGNNDDAPIGYVISKLPMSDNFIVNVEGHTIECKPTDLHLVNNKLDTVEFPHKFDQSTLKALTEQMVQCGMFMHGNRLTPNDCYVKYSDYANANDEDPIRMVVEGETTMVSKKYIKIVEDFNNFMNPADYIEGEEVHDGQTVRNILFNKHDYQSASTGVSPVRVLIDVEGGKSLISLPWNFIKASEI